MKVSVLLIVLGFSQVLARNYGPLTESKSEREDQIEGKNSEDGIIEMGEMGNNKIAAYEAARPELGQPDIECPYLPYLPHLRTTCGGDWHCKQCPDCLNGAYCKWEACDPQIMRTQSCIKKEALVVKGS